MEEPGNLKKKSSEDTNLIFPPSVQNMPDKSNPTHILQSAPVPMHRLITIEAEAKNINLNNPLGYHLNRRAWAEKKNIQNITVNFSMVFVPFYSHEK